MPIHIQAEEGQVAPWVLLPGDPDRTQYIAEKFLTDPVCYTDYRRMVGYTGSWNGIPVSVQTTGMGGPSAAIILHELKMLGVKGFIRIGTCGSIQDDLPTGSLLVAQAAMDSGSLVEQLCGLPQLPAVADFNLLQTIVKCSASRKTSPILGTVGSMDLFYDTDSDRFKRMQKCGILALEMETAALYTVAGLNGCSAASLLVVSDYIPTKERLEPEKILSGVDTICRIALNSIEQQCAVE